MQSLLTYVLLTQALLFTLLLTTESLNAQTVTFEGQVTPSNSIVDFSQDKEGFIWMAGDGLHRFDGHQYISYHHDPKDSTSLSTNLVSSLLVDSNGILWVGTNGSEGALHRFHPEKKSFTRYPLPVEEQQHSVNLEINCIIEDQEGFLWIGSWGKLYKFAPDLGFATTYYIPGGKQGSVLNILESQQGVIWFATGDFNPSQGDLYTIDRTTGAISASPLFSQAKADTASFEIFSLYEDRKGILWIGAWPLGLTRYDPVTKQSDTYRLPDELLKYTRPRPNSLQTRHELRFFDIHEDRLGTLWLATWGEGILTFDSESEQFTRHHNKYEEFNRRGNSNALKFFEDHQGTLWLSYNGNPWHLGTVYKVILRNGSFIYNSHEPSNPKSMPDHQQVYSFHEDREGSIWIGTFKGGVNRFNPKNNTFTHYWRDRGNLDSLNTTSVMSIAEDSSGALWMGTFFSPGIHRFDPDQNVFTHTRFHLDHVNRVVRNAVIKIHQDRSGILWLGTWRHGLIRYDPHSGDTQQFLPSLDDSTRLIGNVVPYLSEDSDGTLWVGAHDQDVIIRKGDLHRFDRKNGTFKRFGMGASHLYEDSSGRTWVVSKSQGLILWNRDTDERKKYSLGEENSSNTVFCLLEDAAGKLWFSSRAGLSRLDPETDKIHNFTHEGDLLDVPFSEGQDACYKARDGTFYFGRHPGFTSFHPDDFHFNTVPPEVAITEVRAGDDIVRTDEPLSSLKNEMTSRSLRLSHFQSDISIQYVGLHYEDPSRNTYRYKLEPYNEDWIDAGTERWARFFQVPPGNYTFRVQSANPNGIWNEMGASMDFTILPPWWRTTWAYIIYGLVLIGGLVAANRIQRQRLIHQEREQARIEMAQLEAKSAAERAEMAEHLEQIKSRFFVNLSHEFRTPLTLILGPLRDALSGAYGSIESKLQHQLQVMQRNGDRLLKLINELLDLEKIESGGLHLQAHQSDLVAFSRALALSFASHAEREKKILQFESPIPELHVYFDPAKMEKVLYNLLSNALKFTATGDSITVSVDATSDVVHIQVADTGKGIPESALASIFERFYQVEQSPTPTHDGTGIGLALAKQLAELHGGTIDVESSEGQGSIFTVILPLRRDHLRDEDLATEDHEAAPITKNSAPEATVLDGETGSRAHGYETATILIVEDNPDVRAYLKSHLADYHVAEAENGEKGLQKALEILPDLIISDVMMPVMDGMALCIALRKNKKTQDVPIVLLTAKATEPHKINGLLAGADDYLYKPFSSRELLVRVENLIDLRHRLQSRYRSEVLLKPAEVVVTSSDAAFIERIHAIVEEQMGDSWFGVERLADEVGLSRRQLQRKMKALLHTTASTFIRDMRLERASSLLQKQAGNVSEVSYAVGYNDPQHFSELFKKKYGYPPSNPKSLQVDP